MNVAKHADQLKLAAIALMIWLFADSVCLGQSETYTDFLPGADYEFSAPPAPQDSPKASVVTSSVPSNPSASSSSLIPLIVNATGAVAWYSATKTPPPVIVCDRRSKSGSVAPVTTLLFVGLGAKCSQSVTVDADHVRVTTTP